MGWTRTIAPNGLPVDLAAVKLHLRITDTDQDDELAGWVADAWSDAESRTNQVLLHGRYRLTLDAFPCGQFERIGARMFDAPIVLPHAPIAAVVSIAYTDASGASQTIAAENYVVNADQRPVTVSPAYGYAWPSPRAQPGAIVVTYDAGYASVATASAAANTLTVAGPVTWATGEIVRVSNSGGALPTGLSARTNYYVKTAAAGVYTLSATDGGATIDLTTAGTGTTFIGEVPDGIVSWIKLAVGALNENREAEGVVERGQLARLGFADGLLDRYRVFPR